MAALYSASLLLKCGSTWMRFVGAVEKVVAIYREKEARNKSLYKYVTEEMDTGVKAVEAELAELLAEEAQLQAAAAEKAPPTAPTTEEGVAAEGTGGAGWPASSGAALESRVEQLEAQLETVLPVLEKTGAALEFEAPQSMDGKGLTLINLGAYLTALEDTLGDKLGLASGICAARLPPPPEEDEEGSAPVRRPPEPEDTPSLSLLKEFVKPRSLSTYNPAATLHRRGAGVESGEMLEIA